MAKGRGAKDSSVRKSTGPRTPTGKDRSKHNAIRDGIFSSAVLLSNESKKTLNSFANKIYSYAKPVGGLEEILVDKLISQFWRYGRVLRVENAQIEYQLESVFQDREKRIGEAAKFITSQPLDQTDMKHLLVNKYTNPIITDHGIHMLERLRATIAKSGLDFERDRAAITFVFGSQTGGALCDEMVSALKGVEGSRAKENGAANSANEKDTYKTMFMLIITQTISTLEEIQKVMTDAAKRLNSVEISRLCFPESPVADRLNRGEAALERNIARTWDQLERAQRIRKGQTVPPTIKLEVA